MKLRHIIGSIIVVELAVVLLYSSFSFFPGGERNNFRSVSASTVTIRMADGQGSGVIFTRKDLHGGRWVQRSFLWTAAHVVKAPEGLPLFMASPVIVEVIQPITDEGRVVGQMVLAATVIKADEKEDIALLELNSNRFTDDGVEFLDSIPKVTEPVFHVGSIGGFIGASAYTTGEIAKLGMELRGQYYDLVTVTALPGCSGGGVFTYDRKCIGIMDRQAAPTVNMIIPARRIRAWAKKNAVLWALDRNVPLL